MTFWLKPWLSFTLNLVINFNPFGINAHTLTECYVRCDWLLPMIYQSTDTWLTSCFVQHSAWFWKCLWDSFGLKQVKASVTSVTHSPAAHVPLFCFYHIWGYLWSTTERTHDICLTELVERTLLSLLFLITLSLDCVLILLHCHEKIGVGHSRNLKGYVLSPSNIVRRI